MGPSPSLRRRVFPIVPVFLFAVAAISACSGSSQTSGFGDTPDASNGGEAGDVDAGSINGGEGGGIDAQFGSDTGLHESGLSDSTNFQDALPDANNADGACVQGDAGAPPHPQRCVTQTANECDGPTDSALTAMGINASLLNGSGGNGFDDDCDGQVDEGCTCPGNGQTKSCYLVPPSQIDVGTKLPVGWCTQNSKGSLDCAGTEFPKWSGTCRGAQPPYRHDVCAPGDFNCDGLDQNSDVQDCTCKVDLVKCPTAPITEQPYPPPANIPIVDGSQWVDPSVIGQTTNWAWTAIGGDCDNVLPHPTFALYNGPNSTVAGARKGTRTAVKFDPNANPARYVATAGQPLVSIQANAYGSGAQGGKVYPAFGLSGDYVVQGEFDLQGKHYVCTQKVQVRAPGIRAELCWDSVGGQGAGGGNDIDLHFARMQGITCGAHGWDSMCSASSQYQDCWYSSVSGCRDFSTAGPGWGYTDSAATACNGWSSKRGTGGLGCTNPRLDKDNITCDATVDDPTQGSGIGNEFCGPENINVDNPKDAETFVVGVNHYYNHSGTANARSHVNLYCNGERVLSVGYNPITGQTFPVLNSTAGTDSTGDFWMVGTIKTHVTGGTLTACDVATIPSHNPDPTRDGPGGSQLCVESKANGSTPAYSYANHNFVDHTALQGVANGSNPTLPAQFCKH
jgi:hypothetical protein